MTKSEADLLTLLGELDFPEWLKWPRSYNRTQTAALFGELAAQPEGAFTACCTVERDTQDSSE
ncbi:hypothetical protein [Streptomyces ehimensis]|uniref:Uncharacterized protein n=1 Tax=Streptomyces ehimensis TaxID=68195 RepID=A0ABV9BQU8_9ACTN